MELFTFHPLGIEKPLKIKSERASLKAPCRGGTSLKTSHATFHEYFIFWMSSQFNNSPGPFDLVIFICSINIYWAKTIVRSSRGKQIHFSFKYYDIWSNKWLLVHQHKEPEKEDVYSTVPTPIYVKLFRVVGSKHLLWSRI